MRIFHSLLVRLAAAVLFAQLGSGANACDRCDAQACTKCDSCSSCDDNGLLDVLDLFVKQHFIKKRKSTKCDSCDDCNSACDSANSSCSNCKSCSPYAKNLPIDTVDSVPPMIRSHRTPAPIPADEVPQVPPSIPVPTATPIPDADVNPFEDETVRSRRSIPAKPIQFQRAPKKDPYGSQYDTQAFHSRAATGFLSDTATKMSSQQLKTRNRYLTEGISPVVSASATTNRVVNRFVPEAQVKPVVNRPASQPSYSYYAN